ncbi:hypothetical protein HanRHA438_Chr11g0502231 [Helianthus annuus]|nr:hypothetical protein HanRHA438_Chr11g0502231 [Helianthus annuus]
MKILVTLLLLITCARSESEGTIQKTEECMKLCSKTPTPVEVSMMSIYPRRMFNIVL